MPVRTACWIDARAASQRVAHQGEQGLDLIAPGGQLFAETVHAEGNAVERVAEDHAQQGNRILRLIPGLLGFLRDLEDGQQGHGGDRQELAHIETTLSSQMPR